MRPSKAPNPLNNDAREFELVYEPNAFGIGARYIWFTQREVRMVMKHLAGRNSRLHDKLKKFISDIDDAENLPTDFTTRVPRTAAISVRG